MGGQAANWGHAPLLPLSAAPGVWPSCPSSTLGYASCILFEVFHNISVLSYLRYFWLCTMSLFFIQQYIVAKTSQFLTEIQTTVSSSP